MPTRNGGTPPRNKPDGQTPQRAPTGPRINGQTPQARPPLHQPAPARPSGRVATRTPAAKATVKPAQPRHVSDLELLVVVPCYNAAPWIARCLTSITTQTHRKFRVVVIDDASTDGTAEAIRTLCLTDARLRCVRNTKNVGALANLVAGFAMLGAAEAPGAVLVTVDGDDWLAVDDAFERVCRAYDEDGAWMTYGSFRCYPSGHVPSYAARGYDPATVARNAFRSAGFHASHLRTFKSALWSQIRDADLRDPDTGEYCRTSWDVAMMMPMLEMAGTHQTHIRDPLYAYNMSNPISDHRVHAEDQRATARRILAMPPYQPLADLPTTKAQATPAPSVRPSGRQAPPQRDVEILVSMPCFNAAPWIARSLTSLASQTDRRFRCVVIDDASTDHTADVVRSLRLDERFEVVRNTRNVGPLANMWTAFERLAVDASPDAICTSIDGDDWLARDDALAIIRRAYAADPTLLMTCGNIARSNTPRDGLGHALPQETLRRRTVRRDFFPIHSPRTWRGKLWSRIDRASMIDPATGDFWRVSGDVAFLAPLVEMAGDRIKFIEDVLYIYNVENPLSDFRSRPVEQKETADRILVAQRKYGLYEDESRASSVSPRR